MGMTRRSMLVGPPVAYGVAVLGYLLWIRKYFTGPAANRPTL
jgi:hypothetical protein